MSRTDQEFKAEVLRRSEEYRRGRRKMQKRIAGAALCLALVICGLYLGRPFLATGGSAEPKENAAPMEGAMEFGAVSQSKAESPAGMAADSAIEAPQSAEMPEARIPMVMVNGVLYLDTGVTDEELRKCGTYDGKITSVVSPEEIPTEDDQSNFGIGYGYQYGREEGTIQVHADGAWRIFAVEALWEDSRNTQ